MKTFRKIFIGALVVLFGSWVNMQAQDVSADANTIVKTVKHASSKSAKEKRAKGYLATHPGVVEFISGISAKFDLDFDCSFKGVTAKASNIMVSFPDAKPFPLAELGKYISDKEARFEGMKAQFADLKVDRPGEGEDKYKMRQEELKNLRIEVSYGVSDLDPEDAILQVMTGNPAEEHQLLTLDYVPECGRIYDMKLVSDGADGWLLVPADEE